MSGLFLSTKNIQYSAAGHTHTCDDAPALRPFFVLERVHEVVHPVHRHRRAEPEIQEGLAREPDGRYGAYRQKVAGRHCM